MKIILASKSPRRRELLEQIGLDFSIVESDCDETIDKMSPDETVRNLAVRKAEAVYKSIQGNNEYPDDYMVIGADTVVSYDGEIMGKPHSTEEAELMLEKLSGNIHSVYTGVCIFLVREGKPDSISFVEETKVHFDTITKATIDKYIKTGEPMDKAGAYGIQGRAAAFITGIEGDYANVVGLPVSRICRELRKMNVEV